MHFPFLSIFNSPFFYIFKQKSGNSYRISIEFYTLGLLSVRKRITSIHKAMIKGLSNMNQWLQGGMKIENEETKEAGKLAAGIDTGVKCIFTTQYRNGPKDWIPWGKAWTA